MFVKPGAKLSLVLIVGVSSLAVAHWGPALVKKDGVTQANASASNPLRKSYVGLNSSVQGSSVNIGGCLPTDYLSGSGNATTSAVVGCVVQPSGTYSGFATWPDAAIAGYMVTSSNNKKTAVGVYGASGTTTRGSGIYGGNFSVVNCRLWATGCAPGGGLDFAVMYGLEVDVNSYSKAGSVAPSGAAKGFIAHLNGDATPSTSAQAYDIVATGGAQWGTGYTTEAAASPVGVFLNSAGAANRPGSSQAIQLISRGAAGAPTTSTIQAIKGGAITVSHPIVLASYTVAALPTCNISLRGGFAFVTDAAAPTYNGALKGGGSLGVPVACDGNHWTSH